ncbi:MAG: hypothetical protein LBI64_07530 [Coriobacteriales bacterium]|nr:hypothetical protein [Coriobacteriales bacterium]
MSRGHGQTRSEVMQLFPAFLWPFGFAFQGIWTALIVRHKAIDYGSVDIHLYYYCILGGLYLAVLIYFLIRKNPKQVVPHFSLCCLGFVLMFGSTLLLSLPVFSGSSFVAALGITCAALGSCLTMLFWGYFFCQQSLGHALVYIISARLVSFLFLPIYPLFSSYGESVQLLLFAIGTFVCLAISLNSLKHPQKTTSQNVSERAGFLVSNFRLRPTCTLQPTPSPLLKNAGGGG